MNPDAPVDLHTHTTQSDGLHPPEELVALAHARNLAGLSVTDHDEVGALARAQACASALGIAVIPGVELSTLQGGFDVHLLGYFINPDDTQLLEVLAFLRRERVARAHRILEKLDHLGLPLDFARVQQYAGEGCIGRPHVAEAMVQVGHVRCFQEAFDNYLAEGRPAFEPKVELSPAEAVAIIHAAGGVASLAHPGQNLTLEVVVAVARCGVDAIETVHPKHTAGQRRVFERLAQDLGLLHTGGSDFHGGRKGEEKLGQYTVSWHQVELLRSLAEKWR